MRPVLKHKPQIVEGCRKYFRELVDKAVKEGIGYNTLEKITRIDDATLRRWYSDETQSPDLGNMLAAL